MLRSERRSAAVAALVLLCALTVVLLPVCLEPHSTNQYETSVDIRAGRLRHRRYLFRREAWGSVEHTAVSRAYTDLVGPMPPPEWRFGHSYPLEGWASVLPGAMVDGAYGQVAAAVVYPLPESFGHAGFRSEAERQVVTVYLALAEARSDSGAATGYRVAVNLGPVPDDKALVRLEDLPAVDPRWWE